MLNAYPTRHTPHAYPTRHATRGFFPVPQSRTDYGRRTLLHIAMSTWNSIPHQVTDASSRIRFKKQIKIHLVRGLPSGAAV